MRTSDEVAELFSALCEAGGKLANVNKSHKAQAGQARYTYANIADVLADVRGPLTECGLFVVQGTDTDGDGVTVTTRIGHKSGQWIESSLTVPVDRMGGIHGVGSAMTYGRRYGLLAMLGIAAEDDDGKRAQDNRPQARSRPPVSERIRAAQQKMTTVEWDAATAEYGDPSGWTHETVDAVGSWLSASRKGGAA